MNTLPETCITLVADQVVEPTAVEDNLALLWRRAVDEAQQANGGNVIRACLWNLVVYNPLPKEKFKDHSGHGYGLRGLLDEVILSLPARIIRLEFAKEKSALPKGKGAGAWVAAKCVDGPTGRRQIYGEEVNLLVHGKSGDSHFPSLVRALLQPSLPIALLGLDEIPAEGWMLKQLLQLCDRVVVDSQGAGHRSHLEQIQNFMRTTNAYVVDIGWMRLTPLRYLLAGFFDAPDHAANLKKLEKITVEATPRGRNTGLLLLGWFLGRCGHHHFKSEPPKGKKDHHRWVPAGGRSSFSVELKVHKGEGGTDGILRVEIQAGGQRYRIRQVDALHVALDSPVRTEKKIALNGWNDAELVIAALGSQGIDPVFVEALAAGAHLLETEG